MNDKPRVLGNRYELGDLLGRGGMAEVHIGRDARLGRVVAIKLLRTDLARDATFQARFKREAQSAAALNHPAIVAVYDTGEEQIVELGGGAVTLPYIVMEYVKGQTLRELMHDGRPLEIDLALDVTARVLSALEYSHRAGIVHRDIKPANVMTTPDGDIKVMDFGIARAMSDASSTMTQTQAVIGTAQYLSPEQARGETVDARSDLYSAGCLLYELLTGRPPFVADSPVAVAYQHVREEPQPPSAFNPAVPEAVDRIVLHSLAKDRETRYQTAADFRADLEAALAGRPVSAFVASAAGAATTQFLGAPAAGTRTMSQAVDPAAQVGAGMLPGRPVEEEYSYTRRDTRPEPSGGNRAGMYVLLALAILVVAGLAAFTISKLSSGGSSTPAVKMIPIAGVVDKTERQARAALVAQGFSDANITTTQAASDKAENTVTAQDPTAGTPSPANQKIVLTLSSGPDSVTIPTGLKGKSQDDARKILEDAGFKVTTTAQPENAAGLQQNQVIRTKPAEGESVAKGSTVDLVLATGNVEIPNLRNKTLTVATSTLIALGLKVADQPVYIPAPADAQPNIVVRTSPEAGKTVQLGTEVTISVTKPASTPPPTSTPTPTDTPSPSTTASPPPTP